MIRFLLRSCGFLFLAASFAALVVDGTRSIAGGRLLQYPLSDCAAWVGGAGFTAAMADLARAPAWVRQGATLLLAVPGWLAAAASGLACLYAGRPRGRAGAVSRHGA